MMGIFSRKQEVNLEDFCRDFYDNQILNPSVGGVDAKDVLYSTIKTHVTEVDPRFTGVDNKKLWNELTILRFELFALAWTHKFISGKPVLIQSDFTRRYLQEKSKEDLWNGMKSYNNAIDGATLHWLTNLGKVNLGFNYRMREDLTAKNVTEAKEFGIKNDDSIERANQRLWSENAWKQKMIIGVLVFTLCERLGIDLKELNEEAQFRLATVIYGFYEGARQSWENVKIKS